ncbi:MAG: hypothetical protein C0593_02725 [Marinilabiliales bacterium]|nr:MAG: hypothetical protein C0593_02725 [Marinilabiliales bacterium]
MKTENTGKLLVYKASAGSGKTFTLVKEYLALALQYKDAYKHILAITFTNKAANEMKERVLKNLRELSQPEKFAGSATNLFIRPWLIEQLKCNNETLSNKAKETLSAILHSYTDLAILTIDSFMQRILKTFASDLEIPVGFETDTDTDSLYEEAMEMVTAQVGRDKDITAAMNSYVNYHIDSDKTWDISRSLLDFFSGKIHSDDNVKLLESLQKYEVNDFMNISKACSAAEKVIENSGKKVAEEFVRFMNDEGLELTDFHRGKNSIFGQIIKVAKGITTFIKPNSYFAEAMEDKIAAKRNPNGKLNIIESHASQIKDILIELARIKYELEPRYILIQSMKSNLYPLSLQNEVFKLVNQIKKDNRRVYISDFNREISKVVQEEAIPFIYERVGEWYHHIMIDEFQDTSLLQWHNLLPLVDNALASSRKSLIVGDAKQAIYRWRGGNAAQFIELPDLPAEFDSPFDNERSNTLRTQYNEMHLENNFRSKREVIAFNNWFFEEAKKYIPESQKQIYDHHNQNFDESNTGGVIDIRFTEHGKNNEEFYLQMESLIQEIRSSGFEHRDIAILVRSNDFASKIASALTSSDIPVITAESLLLSGSRKVQFLISLLRCTIQPENRIDAMAILQYLERTNTAFSSVKDFASLNFNNATENPVWKLVKVHYPDLVINPEKLSLYDLTEHFIATFIPNGSRDAYLRHFLNEVFNFTKSDPNRHNFFEYWEKRSKKASLDVSEGINAVSISTIHKSKGLEYPVVILPVAGEKFKLSSNKISCEVPDEIKDISDDMEYLYFSMNKDLETTSLESIYNGEKEASMVDNVNILYVAMTRASKRLSIICQSKSLIEKGKNPEYKGNMGDLIANVCTSHPDYNAEDHTLSINPNPVTPDSGEKHEKAAIIDTENMMECNMWRNVVTLSSPAVQMAMEQERSARDTGLLIHSILSKIETIEDVHPVIDKEVESGNIIHDEKENIQQQIERIIAHPELEKYFSNEGQILNEREIIRPDHSAYRPDRVVLFDKNAIVIDYKTGEEKKSHKKQIAEYGVLLEEMGYEVEKKALIYINREFSMDIVYV